MWTALRPHPGSTGAHPFTVEVDVARPRPDLLSLRYRLWGDLAGVRLPPPAPPERTDGLWRHTCFEAFLRAADGYYEFNFAPSTQWAAYRFERYREGMATAQLSAPWIDGAAEPGGYELRVDAELDQAPDLPRDAPWRLGVSAVVEHTGGGVSYWALAHPPGKPDFHHPDSFALELPVTDSR